MNNKSSVAYLLKASRSAAELFSTVHGLRVRHLPCGQAVFAARTLKSTVRRKYLEVIAPDHYDDFTIVAEDAGKLPSIPYYSV